MPLYASICLYVVCKVRIYSTIHICIYNDFVFMYRASLKEITKCNVLSVVASYQLLFTSEAEEACRHHADQGSSIRLR